MSNNTKKKYLAVAAHPDDMEIRIGGTLIKLAKAGHEIHLIILANGNAGHYNMKADDLIKRRKSEAEKAAAIADIKKCTIWDIPDCTVQCNLETRERLLKDVRDFAPDVLFTFRPWDYHPDHQAAGQLVQDIAYLITVPMYCPQFPVPRQAPVIFLTYDEFTSPCLFKPDIAVITDDVVDKKVEMMACHESQFFEWLAYDRMSLDEVPESKEDRLSWLKQNWLGKDRRQKQKYQEIISKRYGDDAYKLCCFAETFEISEYGRVPENNELVPCE